MRTMDNPYFTILGRATGRLPLHREGYSPDIPRPVKHAKDRGCFFEINSSPNRVDPSDENARIAKDGDVKIAVNTDVQPSSRRSVCKTSTRWTRRTLKRLFAHNRIEAASNINQQPFIFVGGKPALPERFYKGFHPWRDNSPQPIHCQSGGASFSMTIPAGVFGGCRRCDLDYLGRVSCLGPSSTVLSAATGRSCVSHCS
jgi:hypothetical protein